MTLSLSDYWCKKQVIVLKVVMLGIVTLDVSFFIVMLTVVMLSVMAPSKRNNLELKIQLKQLLCHLQLSFFST